VQATDIERRFGRTIGLLRHVRHAALGRMGRYRAWERVDAKSVDRMVFLCDGNMCRSAYAATRATREGLNADSYGLRAQDGARPPHTALITAKARGVDLSPHRAKNISRWTPRCGDLIVAMEPGQALAVAAQARQAGAQLTLAGIWTTDYRPHIQDPFGLAAEYFDTCFSLLDNAVSVLRAELAHVRSARLSDGNERQSAAAQA
jgi:protein-tyrosine phosphatase